MQLPPETHSLCSLLPPPSLSLALCLPHVYRRAVPWLVERVLMLAHGRLKLLYHRDRIQWETAPFLRINTLEISNKLRTTTLHRNPSILGRVSLHISRRPPGSVRRDSLGAERQNRASRKCCCSAYKSSCCSLAPSGSSLTVRALSRV